MRGFTLLEVLIATALTGIAVAALIGGMSGTLRNVARLEQHEKAVLIARAQLTRLLVEEHLEPGELNGRWDDTYRWTAQIDRWNPAGATDPRVMPPVALVKLTVLWTTANGEKSLALETAKYQVPR